MEAIPREPPTLADVARAAGCGMATASRALSGKGSVAAATVKRVQAAAERLGYRPEPALAALVHLRWGRGGRAAAAAMALVHAQHTLKQVARLPLNSHRLMLEGARQRAGELGYELQEFSIRETKSQEHLARVMANRGVRGLLLTAPRIEDSYNFNPAPFAVVMLGEELPDIPFHRAGTEWPQVIDLATSRAVERGYRRIGFVIQRFDNRGTQRRILAPVLLNLEEIAQQGKRQPALLINDPEDTAGLLAWYREQKPDVIISTSDVFLFRLRDAGVRVPEDTGYITLNLTKTTACVDRQPELIGSHAAELLHQQMSHRQFGRPAFPVHVAVEGRWVDGQTLAGVQGEANSTVSR